MLDDVKRMDLAQKPVRQWPILRDIAAGISFFLLKQHKTVITKTGVEGLKPPYVLLCNHNAFYDFHVAMCAMYPHRSNFIVAIDGFSFPVGKKKLMSREWVMRKVGCICKRKFTNDIRLVMQLRQIVNNGDVVAFYPEARYSLCGTSAVLPESLGKLCKMLNVPVVTLICHGHHINSPFWAIGDRKVKPTTAEFSMLLKPEELEALSVEEINEKIRERFVYDDFAWQKENKVEVSLPNRAEGLHRVLYQCPACKTEYEMGSKGEKIFCKHCGKSWTMGIYGDLTADAGETEFSHIPDWYEWERLNVRREVMDGKYSLSCPVEVHSLPNSHKYYELGHGTMTHDENGFHVEVSGPYGDFTMDKPVASLYSVHIENDYLHRYGDCIDLSTLQDTWFVHPETDKAAITKVALATEELYNKLNIQSKTRKKKKAESAEEMFPETPAEVPTP